MARHVRSAENEVAVGAPAWSRSSSEHSLLGSALMSGFALDAWGRGQHWLTIMPVDNSTAGGLYTVLCEGSNGSSTARVWFGPSIA